MNAYAPEGSTRLRIVPMTLARARAFITQYHRHHAAPQGHKLSFGVVTSDGHLVGVAVVGRPVSRILDTGEIVEATRVATNGHPNACSALPAAAWRTFRNAGYRRLITYIQDGETGVSLRAAGMRLVATLPPRPGWDTPSRPRTTLGTEHIGRRLWEFATSEAAPLPEELWRDVIRDVIRLPKRRCAVCERPLPSPHSGAGRPSRYCSHACRQTAYRMRTATRNAGGAA
ncbi:XF1762 family protein [Nonomuraea sp. NPDC000554]|uniref:XF1762 family protein n=1 Tax=Nonomuraea sp. NPDC000554 TaxID=3154259 RepID=UPI003320818D